MEVPDRSELGNFHQDRALWAAESEQFSSVIRCWPQLCTRGRPEPFKPSLGQADSAGAWLHQLQSWDTSNLAGLLQVITWITIIFWQGLGFNEIDWASHVSLRERRQETEGFFLLKARSHSWLGKKRVAHYRQTLFRLWGAFSPPCWSAWWGLLSQSHSLNCTVSS